MRTPGNVSSPGLTSAMSLERAAAERPQDPMLPLQASEAWAALGRWQDAERVLTRAETAMPNNPDLWLARGDLELRQDHLPNAITCYDYAAKLAPESAIPLCALAQARLRQGDLAEARTLIQKAQALDPKSGRPHFLRAQLLLRTAAPEVAIPELEQAVRLDPDNLAAKLLLGQEQLEVNRLDAAQATLEATLAASPGNAIALGLLARIDLQRGTPEAMERAEGRARQALALNARHPDALYVLGMTALRGNRAAEAIGYLEDGTLAAPERVDIRTNLARAYQRAGRAADAKRQLFLVAQTTEYDKKAQVLVARAAARPKDPRPHTELADLYVSVGGREKAMQEYRKALALSPADAAAQAGLRRLLATAPETPAAPPKKGP